jgi:hypothetical protein
MQKQGFFKNQVQAATVDTLSIKIQTVSSICKFSDSLCLKVPKRDIFYRSDFPDFYTIKSLRVGDFGVKIKKKLKKFRGSFRGAKFLTRMLSLYCI